MNLGKISQVWISYNHLKQAHNCNIKKNNNNNKNKNKKRKNEIKIIHISYSLIIKKKIDVHMKKKKT